MTMPPAMLAFIEAQMQKAREEAQQAWLAMQSRSGSDFTTSVSGERSPETARSLGSTPTPAPRPQLVPNEPTSTPIPHKKRSQNAPEQSHVSQHQKPPKPPQKQPKQPQLHSGDIDVPTPKPINFSDAPKPSCPLYKDLPAILNALSIDELSKKARDLKMRKFRKFISLQADLREKPLNKNFESFHKPKLYRMVKGITKACEKQFGDEATWSENIVEALIHRICLDNVRNRAPSRLRAVVKRGSTRGSSLDCQGKEKQAEPVKTNKGKATTQRKRSRIQEDSENDSDKSETTPTPPPPRKRKSDKTASNNEPEGIEDKRDGLRDKESEAPRKGTVIRKQPRSSAHKHNESSDKPRRSHSPSAVPAKPSPPAVPAKPSPPAVPAKPSPPAVPAKSRPPTVPDSTRPSVGMKRPPTQCEDVIEVAASHNLDKPFYVPIAIPWDGFLETLSRHLPFGEDSVIQCRAKSGAKTDTTCRAIWGDPAWVQLVMDYKGTGVVFKVADADEWKSEDDTTNVGL
ncbi:hypothetical protein EDC01DRAFT_636765 [Geopyxis carbonaria]|nr:hypothetical protein EDC01DRAFT_636765 [Geopyxis carbonaria]